jgi:DNA-binding MarR family transcriptional regulator
MLLPPGLLTVRHPLRRRKPDQLIGDALPAELEELVRSAQLGPRHGSVLYALLEGPAIVGALAARLGLSLATTSNLVAELDRAGLVERRPDPADRRRTIVTISEERRPSIENWITQAAAPFVRTLERLSPSERATFIMGLHALDDALRATGRDACSDAEGV